MQPVYSCPCSIHTGQLPPMMAAGRAICAPASTSPLNIILCSTNHLHEEQGGYGRLIVLVVDTVAYIPEVVCYYCDQDVHVDHCQQHHEHEEEPRCCRLLLLL